MGKNSEKWAKNFPNYKQLKYFIFLKNATWLEGTF
jgi:hypothetical protein